MATTTEVIGGVEFEERREPELYKFDRPGQCVEGVLLSIDKAMVGDPSKPDQPKRPVTKFTVETEDGKKVSFLGTYDIASKLEVKDRGHIVRVTFEGQDTGVVKNGNALRRFKVQVSKTAARSGKALEESTLITDADIPF